VVLAEREGFEPSVPTRSTTVFETVPIDRSGTSPRPDCPTLDDWEARYMASAPLRATGTMPAGRSHPPAGGVVGWFCPRPVSNREDFSFLCTLLPLMGIIISYSRSASAVKGT
jgi:hypothetical protein